MSNTLSIISVSNLLYAFIPVAAVIGILWRWSVDARTLLVATFRMVVQLVLIGYVLIFIFETASASMIVLVLCVMLVASSVISLRPPAHWTWTCSIRPMRRGSQIWRLDTGV